MSRYDWEKGTLKIPTAAWKPLRDTLALAFNKLQDEAYALAVEVHAKLVAVKASGGSKALHPSVWDTLSADDAGRRLVARMENSHARYAILSSVQTKDEATGKVKLTAPKKKDFAHAVSTKATSYPVGDGEGQILIHHETHQVTWQVFENNHAVDRAHAARMAVVLFEALRRVKWARQSGGVVTGNDEYNRSQDGEGAGAHYVTMRFGPLGEKSDPLARLLRKHRSVSTGLSHFRGMAR